MLVIIEDNGLKKEKTKIGGFMVDNAQAGWIVVCNVFQGGIPQPKMKRLYAFHFYQSLHCSTIKGIVTS